MMKRMRKKIKDSNKGVSTTVGTIMAMLIFLSVLSLITQQYVPVWMEDNEAYHMDEVKGQFADMKGDMDNLIVTDQKNYPRYSSINLGTQGVPLFAGASGGRLKFEPKWGETNKGLSIEFGEDDLSPSSGNITYEAYNREFESQTVVYEHGAIILEQSDGAVMKAQPHLSIEENEGAYSMSLTMVDLIGNERSITGTARVGVTTELVSSFRNDYQPSDTVYLNLTTAYPDVWTRYLNSTDIEVDSYDGNTIELEINNVSDLQIIKAKMEVELTV